MLGRRGRQTSRARGKASARYSKIVVGEKANEQLREGAEISGE